MIIQIDEGAFYRREDGSVVGPMEIRSEARGYIEWGPKIPPSFPMWPWPESMDTSYTSTGKAIRNHARGACNLVKKVGT